MKIDAFWYHFLQKINFRRNFSPRFSMENDWIAEVCQSILLVTDDHFL